MFHEEQRGIFNYFQRRYFVHLCIRSYTRANILVSYRDGRVSLRAHLDKAVGNVLSPGFIVGIDQNAVDWQNSRRGASRIAKIHINTFRRFAVLRSRFTD